MYSINRTWLAFNVNLSTVDAHLRAAYPAYTGNSADNDLTLWFSSQPSDADVQAIQTYWSGLTTASPEATGYVSQAQIAAATAALKASCVGVAWDSMTAAQQKSVLNLPLTNADLGL